MQQALPARAACQPAVLAHPVRQRLPAARVLLALPVPPVRLVLLVLLVPLVPLAQRGPAPRPMLQALAPEVHPAAQVPPVRQAARRAHNGSGTGAGSLADYVVLQHVTTHKSLHGTGHGGLWLRSTDGSEPRLLKEGDVISRADFDRVYWADDGNAGGEFQFVASNAQGEPVAHATPHVVPISGHESPAAPEYTTSPVVHVQHDAVAALEASLFTGTNASLKPAAVRIEKIQATNADGSVSENGTPALLLDPDGDGPEKGTRVTEGQRISADDFGKLRWDAHDSEGGRLTFRPVDADGFDYGTSQQVTIHEPFNYPHLVRQASHRTQCPSIGPSLARSPCSLAGGRCAARYTLPDAQA